MPASGGISTGSRKRTANERRTFERVALDGLVPRQHLPVNEPRRVHIDLLAIPRVGGPQLWRLVVDRSHERANHAPRTRLDPRESKVVDLGDTLGGDEDVGALDVPVDDARLPRVKVVHASCDSEHHLDHRQPRRVSDAADVVEQVAVGAELGDDHNGDGGGFLRDRDADEVNDVGVAKVAEEAELFDVHLGEVAANVGNGDRLLAVDALVDVLLAAHRQLVVPCRRQRKRTLNPPLPTFSNLVNFSGEIGRAHV